MPPGWGCRDAPGRGCRDGVPQGTVSPPRRTAAVNRRSRDGRRRVRAPWLIALPARPGGTRHRAPRSGTGRPCGCAWVPPSWSAWSSPCSACSRSSWCASRPAAWRRRSTWATWCWSCGGRCRWTAGTSSWPTPRSRAPPRWSSGSWRSAGNPSPWRTASSWWTARPSANPGAIRRAWTACGSGRSPSPTARSSCSATSGGLHRLPRLRTGRRVAAPRGGARHDLAPSAHAAHHALLTRPAPRPGRPGPPALVPFCPPAPCRRCSSSEVRCEPGAVPQL
ncbi:hypothetical protein SAMN04515665_10560 [Blastococcus sp. DSM 46786]|nr:hypothetical protein SAMN04515665_10560 [Blastococcus sp. DSM 46786]